MHMGYCSRVVRRLFELLEQKQLNDGCVILPEIFDKIQNVLLVKTKIQYMFRQKYQFRKKKYRKNSLEQLIAYPNKIHYALTSTTTASPISAGFSAAAIIGVKAAGATALGAFGKAFDATR